MNVAIFYTGQDGTTLAAARAARNELIQRGHSVSCEPLERVDPARIAGAALVVLGTPAGGLFAGSPDDAALDAIRRLDGLVGKPVAVFDTHLFFPGRAAKSLAKSLEDRGARVVGEFGFHGPLPDLAFCAWAERVGERVLQPA